MTVFHALQSLKCNTIFFAILLDNICSVPSVSANNESITPDIVTYYIPQDYFTFSKKIHSVKSHLFLSSWHVTLISGFHCIHTSWRCAECFTYLAQCFTRYCCYWKRAGVKYRSYSPTEWAVFCIGNSSSTCYKFLALCFTG